MNKETWELLRSTYKTLSVINQAQFWGKLSEIYHKDFFKVINRMTLLYREKNLINDDGK
jgi:hypothetical protein